MKRATIDHPSNSTEQATARDLLSWATTILHRAEIADARLDAVILLCFAANITREDLLRAPDLELDAAGTSQFRELIGRRAGREPVSHLTGMREFWSLPFIVTCDVLDPRPDSEILIGSALRHLGDRSAPLEILDLGTGTGCLLAALLSELPNATGLAVDRSVAALTVCARNMELLGLQARTRLLCADWAAPIAGQFDLLLCNPPYIDPDVFATLAPEVRLHEPRDALLAGPGGMDAYRILAPLAAPMLRPGGLALFEIGFDQEQSVGDLFCAHGFERVEASEDMSGHPRCLVFRKRHGKQDEKKS